MYRFFLVNHEINIYRNRSGNFIVHSGSTQKFGEFAHKKFITVTPSFRRLLRSSPLGSWVFGYLKGTTSKEKLETRGYYNKIFVVKFPEILDIHVGSILCGLTKHDLHITPSFYRLSDDNLNIVYNFILAPLLHYILMGPCIHYCM
jgi:hypothetical protein